MVLSLVVCLAIFATISTYLYLAIKNQNTQPSYTKLPGKNGLPLLGNAHQFGLNPVDYLKTLINWFKEFNYGTFHVRLGFENYVVVTDPHDIEKILSSTTQLDKVKDYEFLHPWLGQGLITTTGAHWAAHRKMITPAFHFKVLNNFQSIMNKAASNLANYLLIKADGKTDFDIQDILNLTSLDIICESAMGVYVKALETPDSPLPKAFHDVANAQTNRTFSPWKRQNLLYPLSTDYRLQNNALKVLHGLHRDVIKQRKEVLEQDQLINRTEMNSKPDRTSIYYLEDDDNRQSSRNTTFLDTLLQATIDGHSLTDQEIIDEVATFVFAGHDTTASALSFTVYYLSVNQEAQQKVYEEQKSIFGDDMNRDATCDELNDMIYLQLVIKETLRLVPSVPVIGRRLKHDEILSGHVIPAGTNAILFLYGMGHNPNYFDDPETFQPERFSENAREAKHPFEYVPFSAGPRNCIGQRFARMELRTVIATLVRKYKILPSSDPDYKPNMAMTATAKSSNGIQIKLLPRLPQSMT